MSHDRGDRQMRRAYRAVWPSLARGASSHSSWSGDPDSMRLDHGTRLGHYEVISLLGKGEMDFERQVNLNFYAIVGRQEIQIPIVRPLLREAPGHAFAEA